MQVPTIETERLRLRAHRHEDFPACAAMWADPEVTKYIGGKPSNEQQTWTNFLSYAGHWQLLGFGYWAIETKDTHEFAGEAGFADFKRGLAPSMSDVPEIGFALASKFHGRGIATEAARAALSWSDRHFASPRTVCLIHPLNVASQKVVEKCGYTVFARGDFNNRPLLFLERLATRP